MKLGADRRKVMILGALAAVAAYFLYSNVFSSPSGTSAPGRPHAARPSTADAGAAAISSLQTATTVSRKSTSRSAHEFRPSLKKTPDIDTSTIDPKLRLDLLAKVQAVELAPATRNIFQFGAAPVAAAVRDTGKIVPKTPAQIAQEAAQQAAAAGPPQPPPPPPITLKYYGYTAQRGDGQKRAFFLDGDDIYVAAEGEMVKRRYKIVRIGLSSAVVEDTQFNNTQTLPLTPEESVG
jgi:hypothetical protein